MAQPRALGELRRQQAGAPPIPDAADGGQAVLESLFPEVIGAAARTGGNDSGTFMRFLAILDQFCPWPADTPDHGQRVVPYLEGHQCPLGQTPGQQGPGSITTQRNQEPGGDNERLH